jgi:hypothetical protein
MRCKAVAAVLRTYPKVGDYNQTMRAPLTKRPPSRLV